MGTIKAGDHFLVEWHADEEPSLIVKSPYDDEQYLVIPAQEVVTLTSALSEAAKRLADQLLGQEVSEDQRPASE